MYEKSYNIRKKFYSISRFFVEFLLAKGKHAVFRKENLLKTTFSIKNYCWFIEYLLFTIPQII